MRRVVLLRGPSTDEGTTGRLAARGLDLHVLEPPWRGNARSKSCIPAGVYDVRAHVSPRFGPCLLVGGTEPRTHILFHAGNVAGDPDLGWHTHSRGCLLPGLRRGRLAVRGRRQQAVLVSRAAMRRLLAWAGRGFILEIIGGPNDGHPDEHRDRRSHRPARDRDRRRHPVLPEKAAAPTGGGAPPPRRRDRARRRRQR